MKGHVILVHGKAVLYGLAAFLTPFSDTLCPVLFGGEWPSLPSVVGCGIAGLLGVTIALRAYYDGSYRQYLEDKKTKTDGESKP